MNSPLLSHGGPSIIPSHGFFTKPPQKNMVKAPPSTKPPKPPTFRHSGRKPPSSPAPPLPPPPPLRRSSPTTNSELSKPFRAGIRTTGGRNPHHRRPKSDHPWRSSTPFHLPPSPTPAMSYIPAGAAATVTVDPPPLQTTRPADGYARRRRHHAFHDPPAGKLPSPSTFPSPRTTTSTSPETAIPVHDRNSAGTTPRPYAHVLMILIVCGLCVGCFLEMAW